jgi:hypothetical protein
MRYGRASGAAAAVLVAAGLAVAAGHLGTTVWWRALGMGVLGFAAWAVLCFAPAGIGFDDADSGCALLWPAAVLVGCTIWFTVADIEVHRGQWVAVTVQDSRCVETDNGCAWQFRVSEVSTERDFGWLGCDDAGLRPGDETRVRTDPRGRHRPSLEACAFTSPRWTTALHVALGVYGLVAIGVFIGSARYNV